MAKVRLRYLSPLIGEGGGRGVVGGGEGFQLCISFADCSSLMNCFYYIVSVCFL